MYVALSSGEPPLAAEPSFQSVIRHRAVARRDTCNCSLAKIDTRKLNLAKIIFANSFINLKYVKLNKLPKGQKTILYRGLKLTKE